MFELYRISGYAVTSLEDYGNVVISCVWMNTYVLLPQSGIPTDGQLQPHACQKGHQEQCLIEGLMANQQLAAQLKSTVLWFERVNVFHRTRR